MKNREKINIYLLAGDSAANMPESRSYYTTRQAEYLPYNMAEGQKFKNIISKLTSIFNWYRIKSKLSPAFAPTLCTAAEGGID